MLYLRYQQIVWGNKMTKQDFLDRLRMALSGRVSPSLVEENVVYYEDYINTQIRLGKSETMVMEALGDPRLIAKTIITTNDTSSEQTGYEYQEISAETDLIARAKRWLRNVRIPGWVWGILGGVLFIGAIGVVFSIISFLLPILLPIIIVVFLVKLFRDWLN